MNITYQTPAQITKLLADLPAPDQNAMDKARTRQAQLTKPAGALGRLEDLAIWLAGWQGQEKPAINAPHCIIFAGNHGVASRGVSAFPSAVTAQMVANFQHGGAAINQLCALAGIALDVRALELDRPTQDFTTAPAMRLDEVITAMQNGADAIPADADLLIPGEMGIGNTTAAAALALAVLGGGAHDWAGAGTGLDDAGIEHKVATIAAAIKRNDGKALNAVEMLAEYGGREVAAIAGMVLAARVRRIPVLLDGYISTAAILPLWQSNPAIFDHCQISHYSQEPGHRRILEATGMRALLDLDMRLGEGSGGAVAFSIVKAALATHNGMATFAEAGVDDG